MVPSSSTHPGKAAAETDVQVCLERRVATDGNRPLLTWYDLDREERTELSARTFANWVDKSANLLVSMDVDEFPRVANTLLVTHSGHWVGLVWTMATWQLGGTVVAAARSDLTATDLLDAAVVGPDDRFPVPGAETIACSLHPLGAAFEERPLGVTDNFEVLGQPDVHWRVPVTSAICYEGAITFGWQDMAAVPPVSARRIVFPQDDPWVVLSDALIAPLLGGGSSVVLWGGDPQRWATVATQERALLP